MTVCIGVLCETKPAAIVVADRMLTSGLSIQFEHPVSNKVTELSGNCLALTSGDAYAHTELFTKVHQTTGNRLFTSVEEFVEVIKSSYQELRHKQIVERILMPRGFAGFEEFYLAQGRGLSDAIALPIFGDMERFNYGLQILVGGISPGATHLYVIDDPGTSHCLDSVGFHAIGSGTNLAMSSLIASKCHQRMELADALLVAVEAKMTAENAPGVGTRTDVSLILGQSQGLGITLQFADDEIKELRDLAKARRDGSDVYIDELSSLIEQKQSKAAGPQSDESDRIDPAHGESNETDSKSSKSARQVGTSDKVQDSSRGRTRRANSKDAPI